MEGFRKSLIVAATVTALVVGGTLAGALAEGPWVAPPEAQNVKNPLASKKNDPKLLADAKKIAETNCFTCHGSSGKGDGPAAAALNPKPANWTSPAVAKETDGSLFWKMTNGRGPMPPWKSLPEEQRWELVNFIRSLQKK